MSEQPTMLVAKMSFTGSLDKARFSAVGGQTRVWSDHPAARKWPDQFEPVVVTFETPKTKPVEQATSAPGEKRGR